MADALDSKSSSRKAVWVQVPPPVLESPAILTSGLVRQLTAPVILYNKAPVPQKCLIGRSCCIVWHTVEIFPTVLQRLIVLSHGDCSMANLAVKNGIWLVRFRFIGKEYKRSLKTSSQREAEAAQRAVEWTTHRISTGQLQLPPDVDAGDFIVSGGLLQKPLRNAAPVIFPSTKSLIDRYLKSCQQTVAPSYHGSQTIHLRHFAKFLGRAVDNPCNTITQQMIEHYLLKRLEIRDPATVKREKTTVTHFYGWVATPVMFRSSRRRPLVSPSLGVPWIGLHFGRSAR